MIILDRAYVRESAHAGDCCGITHIYNFPYSPEAMLYARSRLSGSGLVKRQKAYPAYFRDGNDEYPEQTALDRLKMMISNIEEGNEDRLGRKNGIIEIILNDLQEEWEVILDLDFIKVSTSYNSNSGNTISVYHRK